MSYVILGRKVLNEHIALAVYGLTGLGVYAAMSGESKPSVVAAAPKVSSSDDEALFISNFIANLEKEDAAAKH